MTSSEGKRKSKKVVVEIINGRSGSALYINDERVAGPKPWGGGLCVNRFELDAKKLRSLLSSSDTEVGDK